MPNWGVGWPEYLRPPTPCQDPTAHHLGFSLVWSDTDWGVIFNMAGYLTDEETIRVARSLH